MLEGGQRESNQVCELLGAPTVQSGCLLWLPVGGSRLPCAQQKVISARTHTGKSNRPRAHQPTARAKERARGVGPTFLELPQRKELEKGAPQEGRHKPQVVCACGRAGATRRD